MFNELMASLARALDKAAIPYMVIGGQAVLLHGSVRLTDDVDLTLGVDSSACRQVLTAFRECGLEPRVNDPEKFVERTMILPAFHREYGIRVDFAFSFSPYEWQAIERSVSRKRAGYNVRFASAEDLIIHKVFAGRPQDIQDLDGILARQGAKLDREYVRRWIGEFAKLEGKQHLARQLEELFSRQ